MESETIEKCVTSNFLRCEPNKEGSKGRMFIVNTFCSFEICGIGNFN